MDFLLADQFFTWHFLRKKSYSQGPLRNRINLLLSGAHADQCHQFPISKENLTDYCNMSLKIVLTLGGSEKTMHNLGKRTSAKSNNSTLSRIEDCNACSCGQDAYGEAADQHAKSDIGPTAKPLRRDLAPKGAIFNRDRRGFSLNSRSPLGSPTDRRNLLTFATRGRCRPLSNMQTRCMGRRGIGLYQ